MPTPVIVFIVIFTSVFIHATIGFGVALVSMPIFVPLLGLNTAAPLIALIAMTLRIFLLIRYRGDFEFREIWRLIVTAAICIPIGFKLAGTVDEHLMEVGLGLVIVIYALYSLTSPKLPSFDRPAWSFGLGSVSGLLAGAYNIGGPPVVIYATGRKWPPIVFKGNLQAYAMLNSTLVILTRAIDKQFTIAVFNHYWVALPALILGFVAGVALDGYFSPKVFRKLVQIMLILVGLQLIL